MANSALLFVCVVTTAWQFGAAKRSLSDEDILNYSSTFQLSQVVAPHMNSSLTVVDPNRKRMKARAITGVHTQELFPMDHAADGSLSIHGHVKISNASTSRYHTALQSGTGGPSVISSASVVGSFSEKALIPVNDVEMSNDVESKMSETFDEMQRKLKELTGKLKSDYKICIIILSILCGILLVVGAVMVWVLRSGLSALINSTSRNHAFQEQVNIRKSAQSRLIEPAKASQSAQVAQGKQSIKPFIRVTSREWGRSSPDLKQFDQQPPLSAALHGDISEGEPIQEFIQGAASRLSDRAPLTSSVFGEEDGSSERARDSPCQDSLDHQDEACEQRIVGTDGIQRLFKWMHSKDAMTANLPLAARAFANTCNTEDNKIERIFPPWSVAHLESILKRHSVQVDSWSAETCLHFVNELVAGRAMLVKQGAQTGLYCMIELVLVIVVQEEASEVLVMDVANEFGDELPYVVKHSDEDVCDAAERCLQEKLDGPTGSVKLNLSAVKTFEQEEHSAFYPGLVTIVRKHIIQGSIEHEGRHELCPGRDKKCPLQWKPLSQVNSLIKHRSWLLKSSALRFSGSLSESRSKIGRSNTRRASIQSGKSREVVLPWTVEEVNALLESHHIDSATLGRSLENLSQDASAGLFYFARFADERHLFLVRDIVSLQVVHLQSKAMLVESFMNEARQGHQSNRIRENDYVFLRWPQETRLYHDSVWETARKIVRQQLVLEDDVLSVLFDLEEVPLDLEEARGSRCNIVNRQKVVTAHISQGLETLGDGLTLPTFTSSSSSFAIPEAMHDAQS